VQADPSTTLRERPFPLVERSRNQGKVLIQSLIAIAQTINNKEDVLREKIFCPDLFIWTKYLIKFDENYRLEVF
jgi:hypothetical protein